VKAYEEWARAEGKSIDKELSRYDKHLRHALHSLRIEIVTGAILTQLKSRLLVELAPGSVHHCFAFIRRAINHAISEGLYRGENPVASGKSGKFKMPQVQNCGERFFTPEEANLLLAELKCRSPQVHDMSLLSLKTGLRATEIFSIRGQDVRKATKEIFFTAKNGRRQSVHAPGDIIDILLAYKRKPGEFIFQATNGGPLLWGISDSFTRAVDKLKFNEGISDRRNRVWFHTWRHTFASWLAQSGKMTLHEIKEMLRHERIEMTERYSHLIPGHQASRLDIIDDTLKMGRKADEE
jgi:Site-specific recombinase XerD